MAYVKGINPNTKDSHQTSPAYVLTFVRWDVRDSHNTDFDAFATRKPMVVYNDAVNVSVAFSKSSKNPTFSATLVGGDINYSTALAPGDFVFVNMVDWEADADRIVEKVYAGKAINGVHDGFKGLFKIQTPTRNLVTSPDGHKSYHYEVNGIAFSELDTTFLFNPALADAFKDDAIGLFMSLVGSYYGDNLKTETNVEALIVDLYEILLGKHYRSSNVKIRNYGNLQYKIPSDVGKLLGITDAKYINQIYNLITGVWPNSNTSINTTESKGFNPNFTSTTSGNIFKTGTTLEGNRQLAPENWNYKTVWGILQDNLNVVMNEMYVSFRVAPNKESVMPTIIARQKPFTNLNFKVPSNFPYTAFLNLPRWKLHPDMLKSAKLYKNEALRYNFVQIYTRGLPENAEQGMAQQIALKNFVQDTEDIQRHGMKPYITSSNFDFPINGIEKNKSVEWTQIVADWMINGHLKESGTMTCVGIAENIAVGDNIEFDNVVYHIESISHQFQVMRDGKKAFNTMINVSYGIDLRSNSTQLVPTEMQFTDRFTRGVDDYKYNKLLPGISDSQDIKGRTNGEEVSNTKEKSFLIPNRQRIVDDEE